MQVTKHQAGLLAAGLLAIGVIAAVVFWQLGRPTTVVVIDYGNPEVVELGRVIYVDYCAACHGSNLEGQPNWRQRRVDGRLPAPPHDESGHTWHHVDQQLFEITKYGTAALMGGAYESDMRGFQEDLTDREILAVLAFIKSTWPKELRDRHDDINQRAGN